MLGSEATQEEIKKIPYEFYEKIKIKEGIVYSYNLGYIQKKIV